MKYQSVMDLHTHTVASGHAYCTLREMAKAASDKGLELLGITEHAPKMPGTCHKFYFQNIKVVPREMYGIQLLLGSEVNILDAAGTVDLELRKPWRSWTWSLQVFMFHASDRAADRRIRRPILML